MSVVLLERALDALGPVAEAMVFVGGATIPLHVVEAGGTNFRPTMDVDAVVRAASRGQYEGIAERLRSRGLSEDDTSNVICRWRARHPDLILDVMPDAERVFGFGNRWYSHVVDHPVTSTLPSGRVLQHSSTGALLAMKLEAYADRGVRDPLVSHDLEDIVRIVDSRPSIVGDVDSLPDEVRDFVCQGIAAVLARPQSRDAIPMLMLPDRTSEARAIEIVVPRLAAIAGL